MRTGSSDWQHRPRTKGRGRRLAAMPIGPLDLKMDNRLEQIWRAGSTGPSRKCTCQAAAVTWAAEYALDRHCGVSRLLSRVSRRHGLSADTSPWLGDD